jgi:ribosome-binding factor A
MSTRLQRVEEMLRRELAELLLRGDLRDPRLSRPAEISVTGVRCSPDLGSARVFVDVLTADLDVQKVVEGLNAASSTLRGRLGRRIHLKRTPSLRFEHDSSIEQGVVIERVLAEIRAEEAPSTLSESESKSESESESESESGRKR